jgi:GxxExxY protein
MYVIYLQWMSKPTKSLEQRWKFTRSLDAAFWMPVYQEALELELTDQKIPFRAQTEMPVFYKGRKLRASYRPDILCYDSVIVELKALGKLGDVETAQVLNYLKAGRQERGLLVNFGTRSLQHHRFVWSHDVATSP